MSVNNGTFINDLITNSLEAQSIKVIDSIDVPSITIGGSVFNGDVSGGVTLPYLEGNYLKKTDAAVLQDISSTATQVISTKVINAPSVSTGNVNATNVFTNMNTVSDSAAVNVSYVTGQFPKKADVYTKAASDAITSLKLDVANFNTFQQTNAQNLANKQDLGLSYLKAQTDTLVAGKVDNSTFGTYQGTVTSQLAGKLNVGDAFTKPEVTNLLSGKLNVTYGPSNDAAVASKVSQFSFDQYKTETAAILAAKGDATNVYSKSETNGLLAQKVDNDFFQTYSSANSNALNTKVSQTSFDSFKVTNTTDLNTKVSNTAFGTYQMSTAALIDTKHSIADFNAFNASNTTALGNKVNVSDYNSFKTANDTALALKLDTSVYNTNKQSTDTLISTKANSVDVYNKSQVDSKDAFIQTSLDSYKTSNNTAISNKLDTSVFNSYKTSNDQAVSDRLSVATFQAYDTQLTSNLSNLQQQVNQRLQISTFDTFRNLNNQQIGTKQDANAFLGSINQAFSTGDSPTFAGVTVSGAITSASQLATKAYVDSVGTASVIAGTGLTKASDNTLSINAAQPQITSVGTLASLTTLGNINVGNTLIIPYNNGVESLRFQRGDGGTAQLLMGCALNSLSGGFQLNILNHSGSGSILLQTVSNGQIYLSTNTLHFLGTNDATASTIGAFRIHGGVAIARNLFVGTGMNLSGGRLTTTSSSTFDGTKLEGFAFDSNIPATVTDGTSAAGTQNNMVTGYRMKWSGTLAATNAVTYPNVSTLFVGNPGIAGTNVTIQNAYSIYATGKGYFGGELQLGNNLTVVGTSTMNNLNVSGATVLGATSVGNLTQDIFSRVSANNTNTGSQTHARSAVIQSNNTVNSTFDMFELRAKDGSTVLRSSFGNGFTSIASGLYSAGGQLDMGSTAAGSTISSGTVATLAATGTGDSAQMNLIVNGGATNTGMFKFYRSGSPASPLATISGVDGAITTGNYSTGVVSASTTQTGVNMGRSADFVNWSRTGKIAEIFYQLILISQSGTQSGALTFTLPVASAITCTMDSNYYIYRNGAQITNMRLNLTANSTTCTVTVNNGFGNYVAFALQPTENFVLMFQYPTV